jgi:hypothetical protein
MMAKAKKRQFNLSLLCDARSLVATADDVYLRLCHRRQIKPQLRQVSKMKAMRMSKPTNRQTGAALIIGLILIAIASIGAVATMRGSHLQDRMASNHHNQVIAQMAAETGAARFIDWLTDETRSDNLSNDWASRSEEELPTEVPPFGSFTISEPDDWDKPDVYVDGFARNRSNEVLARATVRLELRIANDNVSPSVNSPFEMGMLADGDIDIRGSSQIWGNIHTNNSFNLNGSATMADGKLSAVGDINVNFVDYSTDPANNPYQVQEGADPIELPRVVDALPGLRSQAEATNNVYSLTGNGANRACDIRLTGDQGGAIFFCPGNAVVSGSFQNATIVAEGNITNNGMAQLGGEGKNTDAISVAFIASCDMIFNGSSTSNGVFWSDGDYRHNGAGVVQGSIVSGGDIRRNGSFVFRESDKIEVSGLPPAGSPSNGDQGSFSVLSWRSVLRDS